MSNEERYIKGQEINPPETMMLEINLEALKDLEREMEHLEAYRREFNLSSIDYIFDLRV